MTLENARGESRKVFWTMLLAACAGVASAWADGSLADFPRLAGETDDAGRLQRAIDATPSGVLRIPGGEYAVASPVLVTNRCSLALEKTARLRAIRKIPFVLKVNNATTWVNSPQDDHGTFVTGGVIDGNGLASCLALDGFKHYTLRDTVFMNGAQYGLLLNSEAHGYELVAQNLYFKCNMSGLAGNTAVFSHGGDSHYTDLVVVDWTVGFHMRGGGSNRLTRCHVWGGMVGPAKPGEPPEMLKDSVNFRIEGAGAILRDCYADTGVVGYEISGKDTRLLGCSYFSNPKFGLDGMTIVRHASGRLLVSEGSFVKTAPRVKVYDGCGTVAWRDMMYWGFDESDDLPGALTFGMDRKSIPYD